MLKKSKVLIIQNYIPKYREYIYDLIGCNSDLVIAHSGKEVKELKNVKQTILKNIKVGPFNYQVGLLRHMTKQDLVIAMFDIHWIKSIVALVFCRWKKIPFYWWGHGLGRNTFFNHLRIQLIKLSNGLILYSENSKAAIVNKGVDPKQIHIAHNTLHISNSAFDSAAIKTHFLFVGQLRPIKRIPELLNAFSQLIIVSPKEDLKLYIVGDGPNLNEYKKLAASLMISHNVIFTGSITDEEKLKELFHKSYAYVSPGDVGLGVLHSFAYGIPVITRHSLDANHGPEFYNISHNQNGLIYDGKINSLVESMLRVLTEENLSKDLGKNAYSLYKKCRSPEHMVSDILTLIEDRSK